MRILLENGSYHLLNMGDVAMLQVAVRRLRELWPGARIQVLTDASELLATYCPDVQPLPSRGRTVFFENQDLFKGNHTRLPWSVFERSLPLRRFWTRWRVGHRGISPHAASAFLRAVSEADLVLVDGGGYITDLFEPHAAHVLDLLGLAIQFEKPTAMFGQGLGPIRSPKLLGKARSVLPLVDLIALREGRVGPGILASLGVPADRVAVTGDDSIELAHDGRAPESGTGIGIGLRVAAYSEVESAHIEVIRIVLQDAARKFAAPLIPVPLSSLDVESDVRTMRQLLGPQSSVAGQPFAVASTQPDPSDGGLVLDAPRKVFQQISRCRIAITGIYHGGVFALAQGIPVVGLSKSAYYADKFAGLAEQFAPGCQVIPLEDPQFGEKLRCAIDTAWRSAEEMRPHLLITAKQQIEASRAAYRRLYQLTAAHRAAV